MDDSKKLDAILSGILGQSGAAGSAPTDAAACAPDSSPWPGDKLRKKVEAEAKRRRRCVRWIEETESVDGVVIAQNRYWRFVKPPTVPKKRRPLCLAKCRDGHPCQARAVPGKDRCRLHGGLSEGPTSQAGRDAITEGNRRRAIFRQAQAVVVVVVDS